jgi:hypothetical protein
MNFKLKFIVEILVNKFGDSDAGIIAHLNKNLGYLCFVIY